MSIQTYEIAERRIGCQSPVTSYGIVILLTLSTRQPTICTED